MISQNNQHFISTTPKFINSEIYQILTLLITISGSSDVIAEYEILTNNLKPKINS